MSNIMDLSEAPWKALAGLERAKGTSAMAFGRTGTEGSITESMRSPSGHIPLS